MSSLPSTSGQPVPTPERSASLVMGNQSFFSVLLRSTAGELYKIRRRLMSKILLAISIFIVFVVFSFVTIAALLAGSAQNCVPANNGQIQSCTPQSSTDRAATITAVSTPIRLPDSLTTTMRVIDFVGPILLMILVGVVVGGEYGAGTIRMLLTRGPTRMQYLLAKILAVLACIAVIMVILLPLGTILGVLYNLAIGVRVDFIFFTSDWVLHAVAYIALEMLKLFAYAMIVLWLATLGRATAAGVAGGLAWWFLEGLLSGILTALGFLIQGPAGDFLKAVPDYFLGNNFNVLLSEQSTYLNSSSASAIGTASTVADWRAWLVIAIYLAIFIGTAWWVMQERDITN